MAWPWSRKRRRTFDSTPRPIDQLWAEMTRATGTTATRSEALSVPAVRRGRNLICSIATLPLEQIGPGNEVVRSGLLEQVDPDVPNVTHLAQTVEDLLFDGISWWMITAQDFAGFPVAARHLDVTTVSVNPPVSDRSPAPLPSGVDPREAVVWVDGEPIAASRVIRFDSPNPAVLKHAGREIRRAILLDQAASTYADDPRPLDYFTPAENADPIDDEEVEGKLLPRWKTARKTRSTAYVPAALKYNTVDSPSPQQLQLVELQKQASLDIANALGIDPEDLGLSTTSRTYSNDVDRRRNKLNEVLSPYMRAVTDRLSMGDVTRRGYAVRFSTAEYLMPNPTERWNNYRTAKDIGALTVEEIRAKEGEPPMPAGDDSESADVRDSNEPEETSPIGEDVPPIGGTVDADRPAQMTFDDSSPLTFADVPVVEFSVDREKRTIEGLALPYGKVASQGGLRFKFKRGALTFSDVSRVKLLRDHDTTAPLGKATQLRDTPRGFLTRFKVARGAAGDEALELAEDGVLDGLSVGVDFDAGRDADPDPKDRSVMVVNRADLREVSLTAMPSFDDARVTAVAASRTGEAMPETTTEATEPEAPAEAPAPASPAQILTAEQLTAMLASVLQPASVSPDPVAADPEPERQVVDPTRPAVTLTREALPYRFDRAGRFTLAEHEFSTDLVTMAKSGDLEGSHTDAGRRVMDLFRHMFTVDTADVNEINPNIQRPDMYVPERDFKYPLWNAINKGAPPNAVQPFVVPKFNTASGLVGDHTEGTEPTSGTFTTTSQTITPTAVSGKVSITRETWDMGGNPAISTILMDQIMREWREALENAAADFLATLTAATDITLTTAAVDDALASDWYAALAGLQFVRSYDFSVFAIEQVLYETFVDAVDANNRPLFPMIGPMNANGMARSRFMQLDLGGVIGTPAWALDSTAGAPNNSWLFDVSTVHGWASTPQRLEFPGTDAAGGYAPVAFIDLAVFGYKAFANTDIAGVRQVVYDSAT